jgi:aspartyl-tRNA(Asn)/glutamyl-tRNA(Gln) amidotransferase subunit C
MKPEDVRGVAELARIDVPDAERERTARELSAVLEFAATLRRLDLEGSEPTAFAPAAAPLREDAPDPRRLSREQAMAAAPERENGFFVVPPIVEDVEP